MQPTSLRFVTIDKLSELSGYTAKAIRRKMERAEFVEGRHYFRAPDGRIHFDLEAYSLWVQGKA